MKYITKRALALLGMVAGFNAGAVESFLEEKKESGEGMPVVHNHSTEEELKKLSQLDHDTSQETMVLLVDHLCKQEDRDQTWEDRLMHAPDGFYQHYTQKLWKALEPTGEGNKPDDFHFISSLEIKDKSKYGAQLKGWFYEIHLRLLDNLDEKLKKKCTLAFRCRKDVWDSFSRASRIGFLNEMERHIQDRQGAEHANKDKACRMSESNQRPTDYKSAALPTELIRRHLQCT